MQMILTYREKIYKFYCKDQMKMNQTIRDRKIPKKLIKKTIKKYLEINELDKNILLNKILQQTLIDIVILA